MISLDILAPKLDILAPKLDILAPKIICVASTILASVCHRELNFCTNLIRLIKLWSTVSDYIYHSFTWPEYAFKARLLPEKKP